MVGMADWKKELERQVNDLRKGMEHGFKLVEKDIQRIDNRMESGFTSMESRFASMESRFESVESRFKALETMILGIRDLLEPSRGLPERVARLEGSAGIPAPGQSP